MLTEDDWLRQNEERAAAMEAESPPHVEAFLDGIIDGWEPEVIRMPEGQTVYDYVNHADSMVLDLVVSA